jgi:hypothetical protein
VTGGPLPSPRAARGQLLEAASPTGISRDAPRAAPGAANAVTGLGIASTMSDSEALVSGCAPSGTRWHRSITSCESLGTGSEAPGASRASLVTLRESPGARRDATPRVSSSIFATYGALGKRRVSLLFACAAFAEVGAPFVPSVASLVDSQDDPRTRRASFDYAGAGDRAL